MHFVHNSDSITSFLWFCLIFSVYYANISYYGLHTLLEMENANNKYNIAVIAETLE